MEKERALLRAQAAYDYIHPMIQRTDQSFRDAYNALELVDADPSKYSVLFRIKIKENFLNSAKTMHGGAIMYLADFLQHITRFTYQEDKRAALT